MNQNPNPNPDHPHSSDYAPYPKLNPNNFAPVSETWTPVNVGSNPPYAPIYGSAATSMPTESNPYVTPEPAQTPASLVKIKTSPSLADAAMGRIAHGTMVLAEGGYEKVFRQTFETVPEEKLLKSYACYLSTSAGPVMGVLYLSTAKLAFCSDNPLSYKVGDLTEYSYYKVVLPVDQLKAVNPSISKINPAEKYIQVISVDNHEFWFMGFVNYDNAVKSLQGALLGDHS